MRHDDCRRRNLKLTIAYDGSGYHGFQRQLNALTVQQVLEEKLSALLGETIAVAGAARTDAGVHAYGQVISFCTTGSIPTERIPAAARGILPRDIAVLSAATMPPNFHARFSAIGKMYLYRVLNSQQTDPMLRNYVWQMERELNLDSMNRALSSLVGEHHFGAFQDRYSRFPGRSGIAPDSCACPTGHRSCRKNPVAANRSDGRIRQGQTGFRRLGRFRVDPVPRRFRGSSPAQHEPSA